MKRLNKILIIFFGFSFLTIYGGWRFIHSRKFSEQASQKVSEILTKKIGAQLAFTGVDFNIFPPSTVFKNVHIKKNDPATADIDLEVEELRVAFTYTSFFSSNLQIDDLTIKNGSLKTVLHDTKSPDFNWKELSLKKIYSQYSDLMAKNPVHLNIARLENVRVDINESHFLLNNFSVAPHKKDVRSKIEASEIHIDPKVKNMPAIDLTKLQANLELSRDEWKVDTLKVEKDQSLIEMKGLAFNQKNAIYASTETHFNLDVENLLKLYPKLPKEFTSIKGMVSGTLSTRDDIFNPEIDLAFKVQNFSSEWIQLASAKAVIKKKKNLLICEKFTAENGNEKYDLLKPQTFFDVKKQSLLHARIPLFLQNAFTNTFLYTLRGSLQTLKGYLTGKVDVVWDGEKVYFEIHDNVQVKDFKLMETSGKKAILENGGFTISDTILNLDKVYKLSINAKVLMNNTVLKATGSITGKDIDISIKDSKLDMKSFGPIAGIAIVGSGPASAEIHGPPEDVKFDFIVDWNNFSLLDLNFGKVKSEFRLSLKDMQIDINELNGVYNQSTFNVEGLLNFGSKPGMDLKLDFKNTTFSDARKMYTLIFKNIKLPVIPEFNFSTTYRIRGGYNVENLKVEGVIKGTDLKVFNEEAERLSLDFSLQNNLLAFKEVKIVKSRGEINANVSINLGNTYTELEGSLQGLRLRDFNFYQKLKLEYDGDLSVDFDGNGVKENFSSRFKTRVNNAFIENIPASPSNALIYLNANEVVVNGSLLSGKIKLDSTINFESRQASLKSSIDATDMREILGLIASHNMSEKTIAGKIKAQVNTQFNIDTWVVKKFFLDLTQFNLKKGDINLNVDPKHNSVAINDGVVKNWDLRFRDGEDFFISTARNLENRAIAFDQSFSVKTSILEFITNSLDKAVGVMKGTSQFIVDKKITVTKFNLTGVKNSLKIKNLPGTITNLEYGIVKKGNLFEISKFTGQYGDGDFKASGTMFFDDMYPQVNIDYKIDGSTIPLFKRSSLLASSSGTITGTDLPYKLNGKVTILHGEFLDDPSDFTKDNKINLDEFKKYLPHINTTDQKGYLNLNISFDTTNQVAIRNNLAEVYLKASGQLVGDVLNPEINARIEVIPTVSKFKFKGHDFLLSQGAVDIRDRGKTRNSELKFVGLARVNDYDVKVDISGSLDKPNIALTSEPSLAHEDLLSLLTLGVTSDMSKNLESSDRKSVTNVGIGTLLVDQLKINEDLNSSLGLKLSVLPEFKEDETTLIQGKSAVSEGTSSRLKSSTKVKVYKQINKSVDVSVSSTVGGSIEQTQEMNINYNINKKFSIQGVYEVKPPEDDNANTPNSIGADLKYKWSF